MLRFKKTIFFLAVSLAFQCSLQAKVISTFAGVSPAGNLSQFYGKIFLIDSKGLKKVLSSSSSLFTGETIKTEKDSFAELRLNDGSLINLGPQSGLKIEEFYYDPNMDHGRMKLRILSGIYRFTTGRMHADKSGDNIKLNLPVGNISVRNATVLGQIFEKRSVTILWKSPLKVESFEPLSVKTKENDPVYETIIEKQGFGCVVEDENFSPTPAIKIPETDIAWIEYKLSPFSAQKKEESPAVKPPEFSIQAIVYDQDDSIQSRLVVVSGKLYKEGDIVEDHKILMIEPKTVAVKNLSTGETKHLKVSETSSKKSSQKIADDKPVIESIFYDKQSPKNSFAYINNTLYREGASVLIYKILTIQKTSVKTRNEKTGKEIIFKLQAASTPLKKPEIPLLLQSISFDPEDQTKSMAALNGILYHQGESWESFELTQIFQNKVLLTDKVTGKTRELTLEKIAESHDEKPDLEIQVILYNSQQKEKSQVAIKGQIYKLGELVEGYEILDIQKSNIRVRKKGDIRWQTHIINDLPSH